LELIKRESAARDLQRIARWIARDNPSAATAVVTRIDKQIRLLVEFPELGVARPELASGLRALVVDRFIIADLHDGARVEVVRIVHGARDLPRALKGLSP
jgi:toxin ParE1/3/4